MKYNGDWNLRVEKALKQKYGESYKRKFAEHLSGDGFKVNTMNVWHWIKRGVHPNFLSMARIQQKAPEIAKLIPPKKPRKLVS